jgi:hypothetical protein
MTLWLHISLVILVLFTRKMNAWRHDSIIPSFQSDNHRSGNNDWIRGGGIGSGSNVDDDDDDDDDDDRNSLSSSYTKKSATATAASSMRSSSSSSSSSGSITKQPQPQPQHYYYPSSLSREAMELVGLWRLDQSLDEELWNDKMHHNQQQQQCSKRRKRRSSKDGSTIFLLCAATIELMANGTVMVEWQNDDTTTITKTKTKSSPSTMIWKTHWTIRPSKASWRGKTNVIEFAARAFQGPKDRIPRMLWYKGYIHRKWTNRHVIQIVGDLYIPSSSSSSSSSTKPWNYHPRNRVGSFVARRRIHVSTTMAQDDDDDEEEEEEEFHQHKDKNQNTRNDNNTRDDDNQHLEEQ